ncbi:MAG: hypothetical protein HQL08_14405, partial [Nitrospirae bacterium]|nr:hypothetical protein [Nitrospirota bacterium]
MATKRSFLTQAVRAISTVLLIAILIVPSFTFGSESGTFRGKWWNYYERALALAEKPDRESLDKAISDLKKAISMRDKDQRMARTYGMHFIDYFPHRELGICYSKIGDVNQAIRELEESLRMEESAKASFYLNKTKKLLLEPQKQYIAPPVINFEPQTPTPLINNLFFKVKGKALGKGLISKIFINNEPYRFDKAQEEISFEKNIDVDDGRNTIIVRAEDLLGNKTEKTLTVTVKREGPTINVFSFFIAESDGKKIVKANGEVTDRAGIQSIIINGNTNNVNNVKSFPITFTIPLEWDPNAPLRLVAKQAVLQASDILNNTTMAEVSLPAGLLQVLIDEKKSEIEKKKHREEEIEKA